MRDLDVKEITRSVKHLSMEANYFLPNDVLKSLKDAYENEVSDNGKNILAQIIENADIAKMESMPLCQDTGFTVVYLDIGQEVHFTGGDLVESVNEGIRQGYTEGYLRKSIVEDPLRRVNTKDNTPGVVHINIVPGDKVKIMVAPKGGGCENMGYLNMMKPADGVEGFKKFIVESVRISGGNPCPPIVVGVGIGGTLDKCTMIAKKALFRKIGERNPDPFYADMEVELLEKINKLGIGPMGLGGRTTALDVFIEAYPCHIASMPAAVNINCHSARHASKEL